jgi:hypothetical protein
LVQEFKEIAEKLENFEFHLAYPATGEAYSPAQDYDVKRIKWHTIYNETP